MKMVAHVFTITGVSPLLQACPKGMAEEGAKKKPESNDPAERKRLEAEALAYRLPSGQLYGPAVGLRRAILYAAVGRKFTQGKKQVSAPKIARGGIFNEAGYEVCPLFDPDTHEPIHNYEIDSQRAVNRNTGGAIMLHRPKVQPWATDLVLSIDEDLLSIEQVLVLLEVAGAIAGWGAFRPERDGPYGRFRAAYKGALPTAAGEQEKRKPKARASANERLRGVEV
jgi:hypothetical protein